MRCRFALVGLVTASTNQGATDDALSLLQLQSHRGAPESVTLRPLGEICPEDEILTYEQCIEAMRDTARFPSGNERGARIPHHQHMGQSGCYWASNTKWIYYNPGPYPGKSLYTNLFRPICGPQGGRKQEVLDNPTDPMPDLLLKPVGEQCAPGCGLTYDQCNVAQRDHLVPGALNWNGGPAHAQLNPGANGCYWATNTKIVYWNPEGDKPLPAGLNLGSVAHVARHICGCDGTTTTTTTDSGHVCKHYETEDTCPEARCTWDGDSCTDPPCSFHTEESDCCGDCEWEAGQCQPALFKACPKEGTPGSNVCPEGCTFVDNCEQCEFAAGVWKKKYSTANWPASSGSRPQGCFRNRKFNIKCNIFAPGSKYPSGVDKVGKKRGKWPICKLIEPPKKKC